MNVEAVDLGEEIGVGIQLRLDLAPVVIARPIPRERLNEVELHALGAVRHCLLLGVSRREAALAQLGELRLRDSDGEWPNRILVYPLRLGFPYRAGGGHGCHAVLR